jgi:hypothetical protein
MFSKIAQTLELHDTPEASAFGAGIEAFLKKAQVTEEEAETFVKAAAQLQMEETEAAIKKTAFETGYLKFAADVGLNEQEYQNFLVVANSLLQE